MIVPLGFLALLLSFLWTRAALLLARIVGFCTSLLTGTVAWFSHLPRVSYRISGPPAWLMLAFLVALAVPATAARSAALRRTGRIERRKPARRIAPAEWASGIALAALTILVASHPFAPRLPHGKLEATVLDVGQGDSIFTVFPDGQTMLVDGGGLSGSEWVGGYRSGTDVGEQVV